ncbi:metallophosphoesterase [Chthoniobacter flavus Ellin428]|uniref:Metallophosphoesterase n=1 Tax=Chthoniobacter flavus Ellin428 TaxID=497964 RepID=B4D428_9BACT|nr:metallophosphoesterase [Chthoniobacter flavus]EDY19008.1 metallophosphoesterase [Chthoniobacter flavus Ellin428]TCO93589.1 3',5'-cyclic AMP phosphodiesterase CpdA [Chthoniobacter flavus]
MPLHISPISRREFLRRSLVAGAGLLTIPALRAADSKADPNHWALLSDTHVAADATLARFDVNMADHLRNAVAGVRALSSPPAGVIVNGDCAFNHGLAEDYATFTGLLHPLSEAGLPLHLSLGNHDDREVFWNAIKDARQTPPPLASRQVSIVEAGHANWFMLDSLDVTNKTPGVLGDEQRAWLSKALDARTDKPALVVVHHDPMLIEGKKTGLLDTAELLAILKPRSHVKALIFGHTHTWRLTDHDGLHLVNLPAVGYPFKKEEVTGWVDCQLRADGMSLEMHAHDTTHPEHGKVSQLTWRTA